MPYMTQEILSDNNFSGFLAPRLIRLDDAGQGTWSSEANPATPANLPPPMTTVPFCFLPALWVDMFSVPCGSYSAPWTRLFHARAPSYALILIL